MIDVIITSTCRKTIEIALGSFLKNVHSKDRFNFIVNIDVLNKDYLARLLAFLKKNNIRDISINEEPHGIMENHARALSSLFGRIKSRFFFHLEDDWLFLKGIDIDPLVKLMDTYAAIDQIRLSKEKIKQYAWLYHVSQEISPENLVANVDVEIDSVKLVKTPTWTFNPSLGRTSIVKNFTELPFTINPESYICGKYPVIAGHKGLYILGRIGDMPVVRDIGRNRLRQFLRKTKYLMGGGKYAEYKF